MTPFPLDNNVYFVGGDKGGVGKSFIGNTLINYLLQAGLSPRIVDAEQPRRDVGLLHESRLVVVDTNLRTLTNWADLISAIDDASCVVVNTPAAAGRDIEERIGYLARATRRHERKISALWVMDHLGGGLGSLQTFLETQAASIDRWLIVLNGRLSDREAFKRWDASTIKQHLLSIGAQEIFIPALLERIVDATWNEGYLFDEVALLPGDQIVLDIWQENVRDAFDTAFGVSNPNLDPFPKRRSNGTSQVRISQPRPRSLAALLATETPGTNGNTNAVAKTLETPVHRVTTLIAATPTHDSETVVAHEEQETPEYVQQTHEPVDTATDNSPAIAHNANDAVDYQHEQAIELDDHDDARQAIHEIATNPLCDLPAVEPKTAVQPTREVQENTPQYAFRSAPDYHNGDALVHNEASPVTISQVDQRMIDRFLVLPSSRAVHAYIVQLLTDANSNLGKRLRINAKTALAQATTSPDSIAHVWQIVPPDVFPLLNAKNEAEAIVHIAEHEMPETGDTDFDEYIEAIARSFSSFAVLPSNAIRDRIFAPSDALDAKLNAWYHSAE
jgi:hypothetical protein